MSITIALTTQELKVLQRLQEADRLVLTEFADQPDQPILSTLRVPGRAVGPTTIEAVRTLTPEEHEAFVRLVRYGLLQALPPEFAQAEPVLIAFQNEAVETTEREYTLSEPAKLLAARSATHQHAA